MVRLLMVKIKKYNSANHNQEIYTQFLENTKINFMKGAWGPWDIWTGPHLAHGHTLDMPDLECGVRASHNSITLTS